MRPRPIVLFVLLLSCGAAPALSHAGIVTYTDIDEWRAAASGVGTGVVTTLDFETLPDGTPTPFDEHVPITPEFNYTDQGVTFSSPFPDLFVERFPVDETTLEAQYFAGSSGRNWIIADSVTPATAVGIVFPGNTTFSVFNVDGELLTNLDSIELGGVLFLGVTSDVPIASAIFDRGSSGEILNSFHVTPVPDPAALVLLGLGGLTVLARKARKRR